MKIIHNPESSQITFLDERFYFNKETGKYNPSVSTILDVYPKGYGFVRWLKDLGSNADVILARAQEQGSNIHDAIDMLAKGAEIKWIDGEKENYTLAEWLMILKFVDFYKAYKPTIITSEESLVSDELGYGGTLDLVCKIKGEVWYIDYKSGKAIYKTNKIQAAAYQKLWNGQKEDKIERLGCLHLQAQTRGPDRTGKNIQGLGWKLDEATEPEKLYRLFEHSHAIWREENPNPRPKNIEYPDILKL